MRRLWCWLRRVSGADARADARARQAAAFAIAEGHQGRLRCARRREIEAGCRDTAPFSRVTATQDTVPMRAWQEPDGGDGKQSA